MIHIGKPVIELKDNFAYLSVSYKDDVRNIDTNIYYRTEIEYGGVLCDQVADPFVLLALLPAIKSGQHIVTEGAISADLKYRLDTSLIYLFTTIYNPHQTTPISITANNIIDIQFDSYAVACGCSLGIDSLSAIKRHCSESIPKAYRLTHLTFFNIGALGEHQLKDANTSFKKELPFVKAFSEQLDLPLVILESNSSILFSEEFDFENTHTLRNACAVLSMQKFFSRYYYASSFPLNNTCISSESMSYMDAFLLPLLSNRNVQFILADADKSRVQKTEYIAHDKLVQGNLYVCWRDIFSNGNPEYKKEMDAIPYRNCTRCDKCLRTALTLDILGVLDKYSSLFDLEYYYTQRQSYLFTVLAESEINPMYYQIASLIKNSGYVYPKVIDWKLNAKRLHLLWLWNTLRKISGH